MASPRTKNRSRKLRGCVQNPRILQYPTLDERTVSGEISVRTSFYPPLGMAVDNRNNVYIADTRQNCVWMIPRESGDHHGQGMSAGQLHTIAGDGTSSDAHGDGGPAIQASLPAPCSVATSPFGDLFVLAGGCVRKVDPAGLIDSVIGPDSRSYWGIADLTTDSWGNLYLADPLGHCVHMLPAVGGRYFGMELSEGTPYTIVGNGAPGSEATSTRDSALALPNAIAVDSQGNLYVSHAGGNVRMVANLTGRYFDQVMRAGEIRTLDIPSVPPMERGGLWVDTNDHLHRTTRFYGFPAGVLPS
ncbi:NHL repeat protein [compost metagenome]